MEHLADYILSQEVQPTHIEVEFQHERNCVEAKKALENMFYDIDVLHYGNQFTVVPTGVSKLTGLLYVCEKWKIPIRETVAIGCDLDDQEMIESAGLGVAMGNAPEKVKNVADWITRSNNEDGVAYMVFEHFRKQQPISFLEKLNSLKKQ